MSLDELAAFAQFSNICKQIEREFPVETTIAINADSSLLGFDVVHPFAPNTGLSFRSTASKMKHCNWSLYSRKILLRIEAYCKSVELEGVKVEPSH